MMDSLSIHNEHSLSNTLKLNFLPSDEIFLTLFLPFVRQICWQFPLFCDLLLSSVCEWLQKQVQDTPNPQNVLIPAARAEGLQADCVYASCCEMQHECCLRGKILLEEQIMLCNCCCQGCQEMIGILTLLIVGSKLRCKWAPNLLCHWLCPQSCLYFCQFVGSYS